MARQKQDGLHYFSFDTDFFYADKRIKRLHSRYGNSGLIFYIYLLTEIYRNGYYTRWDEDIIDDAMGLHLKEGFIEQVMAFLVDRGLIVKIMIKAPNNSDTIITSPGIQRRYQEAVKSLRRDVFVNADIWLLSKEETASCIKVTLNEGKSSKNEDKSGINDDKSSKNATKENKLNKKKDIGETKENQQCKPAEFELKCVDYLIQCIQSDLPGQKVPGTEEEKRKWAVHISRMQDIDKIPPSDIWNTLVWTMKDPFWSTNIRSTRKFREKYSTLYLQSKRKKKAGFTDFENQRTYDWEEFEKEFMSN